MGAKSSRRAPENQGHYLEWDSRGHWMSFSTFHTFQNYYRFQFLSCRPPKTSYGLITADGKCIPFDVASNEKVSGMLKVRKNWSENTVKIEPTKVEVIGTKHGGEISVDEIQIGGRAR